MNFKVVGTADEARFSALKLNLCQKKQENEF